MPLKLFFPLFLLAKSCGFNRLSTHLLTSLYFLTSYYADQSVCYLYFVVIINDFFSQLIPARTNWRKLKNKLILNWRNLRIIEKMKEGRKEVFSYFFNGTLFEFFVFSRYQVNRTVISRMDGSYKVNGLKCQPLGYYSSLPVQLIGSSLGNQWSTWLVESQATASLLSRRKTYLLTKLSS